MSWRVLFGVWAMRRGAYAHDVPVYRPVRWTGRILRKRRLPGRTVTKLTAIAGHITLEDAEAPVIPKFEPKPPSGLWLFNWLHRILRDVRAHGVLRAMSMHAAGWAMVALAYIWKARQNRRYWKQKQVKSDGALYQ